LHALSSPHYATSEAEDRKLFWEEGNDFSLLLDAPLEMSYFDDDISVLAISLELLFMNRDVDLDLDSVEVESLLLLLLVLLLDPFCFFLSLPLDFPSDLAGDFEDVFDVGALGVSAVGSLVETPCALHQNLSNASPEACFAHWPTGFTSTPTDVSHIWSLYKLNFAPFFGSHSSNRLNGALADTPLIHRLIGKFTACIMEEAFFPTEYEVHELSES
jgi:hypothetical protein